MHRLSGWHMPKLWPKAAPARRTASQPSTWSKMARGTQKFFSKTADTLTPWDNKPAAPPAEHHRIEQLLHAQQRGREEGIASSSIMPASGGAATKTTSRTSRSTTSSRAPRPAAAIGSSAYCPISGRLSRAGRDRLRRRFYRSRDGRKSRSRPRVPTASTSPSSRTGLVLLQGDAPRLKERPAAAAEVVHASVGLLRRTPFKLDRQQRERILIEGRRAADRQGRPRRWQTTRRGHRRQSARRGGCLP